MMKSFFIFFSKNKSRIEMEYVRIADMTNESLMAESGYNFFDWFCKYTSLKGRAKRLIPKVQFLVDQGIINPETTYAWFKNNCPVSGKLYDDFRFTTIDKNYYIGGIAPAVGYNDVYNECHLFLAKDNFETVAFENWEVFKNKVKNDSNFREQLKTAMYIP